MFTVSKVTTHVGMLSFGMDTASHSFVALVSAEIRCSGVSSTYCSYGNCAAASKPI